VIRGASPRLRGVTEYAVNLAASLRAGALLGPNEAARAVLPLAETLADDHARGVVHGTLLPAYLAPELTDGGTPTAAADVWTVGALLFHAMAGHRPYDHSPETPARLRRAGWLGPVVELALSRDPAARPQMAEVASYLQAHETPPPAPEPTLVLTPDEPALDARPSDVRTLPPERRTRLVALVLAATVLVLALIAAALLLGSPGNDPAAAPPPGGATSSSAVVPTTSPTAASTTPAATPTAGTLEAFARTYVMAASRDPRAGFRYLTPAYQRASPDYRRFWASVGDPRILRVSADPRRMTTTYTYRYTLPGPRHRISRTETVTLRLVRQDGALRIAGAS
jgi:hypothetical protein